VLESTTAVVVNYETPDYTIRAVRALLDDGMPLERVVVVDNGSTDGSVERLQAELPGCRIERIEDNVGYARAGNRGAALLPGDAYLLVNSDAFVERPGSLQVLIGALADPGVGIVVPRLLNEDRTLQPNAMPVTTPGVALVRASGVSRLIPNRWQTRWSTHWDHSTTQDIESADGPVYLVRGALWDELGGYTEREYMYAEDLDLCLRARRAGWRIRFVREAEFVHVGMGSTSRWTSAERSERIGRSEAAMIREHLSPLKARLTLAFLGTGLAGRWLVYRLLGKRDAAASLRGSLKGYLGS
jgi:N-acetylglucosaminyl-diphospho-decaprenol L-rhamnosyltransferase